MKLQDAAEPLAPAPDAPITALIVRIDAAEPLVGDLRARYDPDAAGGVPPHVTVLVPFLAPADIDDAVLARLRAAIGAVPAFDARFARIGRWPEGTWLAPEPASPFVALTRAVWAAFPAHPPYAGRHPDIVPHLTVAWGTTAEAEACAHELAPRLAVHGALQVRCDAVELTGNAGGRWRTLARLPLGASTPP